MTLPADIDQQLARDMAADQAMLDVQQNLIDPVIAPVKGFLLETAEKLGKLVVGDDGGTAILTPDGKVICGGHLYTLDQMDLVWFGFALDSAKAALVKQQVS